MKKIGDYLQEKQYLRDQDIPAILALQQEQERAGIKSRFGEVTISMGAATPAQVNDVLLKQRDEALARTNLGTMLLSLGDLSRDLYSKIRKTCVDNDETWEIEVLDRKLVTPERLKAVKDMLGLARHIYFRDIINSRFIPFNMMEPLVIEKIDGVLSESGQCTCSQCWNNTFALALSALPGKYISHTTNILEYVERLRPEYNDDVLAALRSAAAKVRKNPKLSCASQIRPEQSMPYPESGAFETVVHVSNRHIHLCQRDLDVLFGKGYALKKLKDLQQPGQFAAEETVELQGPKGRLSKVRVLGPIRPQTQVEISGTDQFVLGTAAPVRESGDVAGTPGVRLKGPAGETEIMEGLIRALRHIHMTPGDADAAGVSNGDLVKVRIEGDRPAVLEGVLIRVSDKYSLEMHIDTDEANAVGMPAEAAGKIIAV